MLIFGDVVGSYGPGPGGSGIDGDELRVLAGIAGNGEFIGVVGLGDFDAHPLCDFEGSRRATGGGSWLWSFVSADGDSDGGSTTDGHRGGNGVLDVAIGELAEPLGLGLAEIVIRVKVWVESRALVWNLGGMVARRLS